MITPVLKITIQARVKFRNNRIKRQAVNLLLGEWYNEDSIGQTFYADDSFISGCPGNSAEQCALMGS